MEPQKAFVREDGTTVLKCPYCRHARTVSVEKIKDKKKVIKVKCSCQESYSVSLELRKMYRKSTSLKGRYVNLSLNNETGTMVVKDVSMGGIGFEAVGANNIKREHELEVTFTLDDTHSSVVKKQVVVRIVRDKFVGCEFLHAHEYDKSLGFYLLP
ncbi:PilZ domain-containing protein [Thermodesulfobacteriota bacterium]